MFDSEEIQAIARVIEDAGAEKTLALIHGASIAQGVWAWANKGYFHDREFYSQPDDPKDVRRRYLDLAEHLKRAQGLIDAALEDETTYPVLRAAAGSLHYGRVESHYFGGAADDGHVLNFYAARQCSDRFFEICEEREVVAEPYCWPSRIVEHARGLQRSPEFFVGKVIDDISHDVQVLSIFFEALASCYSRGRGGQDSGAKDMWATCISAWHAATGEFPTTTPGVGEEAPETATLYRQVILMLDKLGASSERGLSYETFRSVVLALRKKGALKKYREQRRYDPR